MFLKPKLREILTSLRLEQIELAEKLANRVNKPRSEVIRIMFDVGAHYIKNFDPPQIEGAAEFWEGAKDVIVQGEK